MEEKDSTRYSRQLALPGFNIQSQQALGKAKVLVVGCGGLGNPVLQYLTAAGIGTIGVLDDDFVQIDNLQRQTIFKESDVGITKVDAAIARLQAMNSQTLFVAHKVRLTTELAAEIFKHYEVIVDCTDNFPTRYIIDDTCEKLNIPMVFGALHRYEGQVSVFHFKKKLKYRDICPKAPTPGLLPDCETGGVLGTLAGTIGCIQANEVIKIVTGIGEVLDGKLMMLNMLDMNMIQIEIKARTKSDTNTNDMIKEIDAATFKAMQDRGDDFQLIDVREPFEYEEYNIKGELIPMNTIPTEIEKISREKQVVIHCKGGTRSGQVIQYLEANHGFTNLYNLQGGVMAIKKLTEI